MDVNTPADDGPGSTDGTIVNTETGTNPPADNTGSGDTNVSNPPVSDDNTVNQFGGSGSSNGPTSPPVSRQRHDLRQYHEPVAQ